MNSSSSCTVLLDAHVHLYDCFDLDKLFKAAHQNAITAGKQLLRHDATAEKQSGNTQQGTFSGSESMRKAELQQCLFCVDLQDKQLDREIERLTTLPGYQLSDPDPQEPDSRTITQLHAGFSMQIVWGHQLISAENIEVLGFGMEQAIANGTPLLEIIDCLKSSADFGILPWGFGKWHGSRGMHVQKLLQTLAEDDKAKNRFYVGDNGGRWLWTATPKLLDFAQQQSIWNIPGSDPLPFPRQHNRPGSRGVVLKGTYNVKTPRASISRLLSTLESKPAQFGEGETTLNFVKAQFGMQLRKHLRRRTVS